MGSPASNFASWAFLLRWFGVVLQAKHLVVVVLCRFLFEIDE